MQEPHLKMPPELQQAIAARPDEPLYIEDAASRKTYLLIEQGKFPELEEEYVREALDAAREQIERGELSRVPIQDVIRKAQQPPSSKF